MIQRQKRLTNKEIFSACRTLTNETIDGSLDISNVTVESVLTFLGRGSAGTINPIVSFWKRHTALLMRTPKAPIDVLYDIAHDLENRYQSANLEADHIDQLLHDATTEISADLEKEQEDLRHQLAQSKLENEQLQSIIRQLEQTARDDASRYEELSTNTSELQAHIDQFNSLLRHSLENLQNEHQSRLKDIRSEQQQRLDDMQNDYQKHIEELRNKLQQAQRAQDEQKQAFALEKSEWFRNHDAQIDHWVKQIDQLRIAQQKLESTNQQLQEKLYSQIQQKASSELELHKQIAKLETTLALLQK